ncbi:MAG TPA: DUF3090 domain-containing protein [Anaerolineales bacterium]|nr:DUF3090 domain-containing protein [Anaerolineales bacterium]
MPGQQFDLNPVTRITTGAVGPPGKRVFYLQARGGDEMVTLIVEKIQVQSLAVGLEQFLVELAGQFPGLPEASASYDQGEMELETPIDPAFRVGQIGLGYDQPSDRIVVVARELQPEGSDPEEASVARLWCTRDQLRAMCQHGLEVASRGRPICGNCGEPIDPEGHFCPRSNGHKD